MSTYMNYEVAGKRYDEARVADGIEMMCKMLTVLTGKDMSQIDMLDVGCGTGNYSLGFLKHGCKNLKMIDASSTMIENAKEKTKEYRKFVDIQKMVLPKLEFPNESFDAVSIIQVLHHIDSVALQSDKEVLSKEDYPNLIETFKQVFRVLRPEGVLMLDTMFEENIDSFWWTSLCPKAAKIMKRTRIKKEDLFEVLSEINFIDVTYIFRPNSCLLKREIYDQIENIGDDNWRTYLSQYKLVENSGELGNLISVVQEKVDNGSLSDFLYELNKNLRAYGNHVTVFARKCER